MTAGELRVIWKSPRHVFVWRDDLALQIRGEPLSLEALDAHETGLRLARAQFRHPHFGALLVIEEGAPAPTGEVAKRQRELVGSFASDERVIVCVVIEGRGPLVGLKRTIARGIFHGPRRHICGTVREGAQWLAAALGDPSRESEIAELAAEIRTWR